MDYLNSIVKVEHRFLDLADLHSLLDDYGSIDAFLPCISTGITPKQVFVRFNSAQAAQRAYNAQDSVRGLRVSTLSQDPCLLHQYLALCSLNLKGRDSSTPVKQCQEPRNRKEQVQIPGPKESAAASASREKGTPKQANGVTRPVITFKPQPHRKDSISAGNTAISKCAGSSAPKDPVDARHPMHRSRASQSYDTLGCQTESNIITTPASFCMASKIELRVAGEQFIYDLSKLEDDPKSIIELLKLASAERAHWMIVAAFYRRRGNARAAIGLMMELIKVLKCQGVDWDKMKPVYLMLSGCETDLARDEKENSSTHYTNSRTWLQKVYGTFDEHSDGKTRNKDKSSTFANGTRTLRNDGRLEEMNIRAKKRPSGAPGDQRNRKRRRLCMNQQRFRN